MSELRESKVKAEITILCKKNRRVSILSGRFGTYAEAYEHAAKCGYRLIAYCAM